MRIAQSSLRRGTKRETTTRASLRQSTRVARDAVVTRLTRSMSNSSLSDGQIADRDDGIFEGEECASNASEEEVEKPAVTVRRGASQRGRGASLRGRSASLRGRGATRKTRGVTRAGATQKTRGMTRTGIVRKTRGTIRKVSTPNRRNDCTTRIAALIAAGKDIEPLPGRVDEFDWIKRTVGGLLASGLGGCLYVSGVPGTGKTATTHRALDALTMAAMKDEGVAFDFVEINGMRLSDPGQAYSILAGTILPRTKRTAGAMSGTLALKRLETHFKSLQRGKEKGRPCVVLLDELDLLLRKRQSLLYHFFEWPNWTNSQLVVVTIANTMDLPERFLSNRISSRLGLTRYNFKPYDHAALAHIIEHQLQDYVHLLGKDAIQLCARKVSAVSGDARRAVNYAKRAVDCFRSCTREELLERTTGKTTGGEMTAVNLRLMDLVMRDALMANPVQVIGRLAKHQRLMLLALVLARKRMDEELSLRGGTRVVGGVATGTGAGTGMGMGMGTHNPTIGRVMEQHLQLCRTHQFVPPSGLCDLLVVAEGLEALRLVRIVRFREHGSEGTVQLLVHEEDVRRGLGDDQALRKYLAH